MKRIHWLFASFLCLFIIHSTVFIFYINHHKHTIQKTYQDDVVQEVMNIIHMVQATPINQLERAIATIESTHIKVTLSNEPKYKNKITDLTMWRLRRLIDNQTHDLKLSLDVPQHRWVNIKAQVEQSQSIWPNLFILIGEIFVACIILFYAWSINRFIVPLKDFQAVAKGLGISLTPNLLEKEYKGPSIIQETALAMNKMQQRIKDLINDRTLMLAAISHDLKTPITRLKLRAHLFSDEKLTVETLHDLNEMEAMISELLIFSKNENDNENKQKLEMNSFIETICHEIYDMNFEVNFHRSDKRVIYAGSKLALKRALSNVILNAVKYGANAEVYLLETPTEITIRIDDNGPGMKESEFENVFTPFYRLDHSRSRAIEGTGLGLSIARSAIRNHGGEIYLSNRQEGGLRVEMVLKKAA